MWKEMSEMKLKELKKIARRLQSQEDKMAYEGRKLLTEIDWRAVHALERPAPWRINIPELQARSRLRYITKWREDKREDVDPDHKWLSWVFVYRDGDALAIKDEGDPGPEGSQGQLWMWVDHMLMALKYLDAEVAAIYRVKNIEHTIAGLFWERRDHILAQLPQKDAYAIGFEGAIEVCTDLNE